MSMVLRAFLKVLMVLVVASTCRGLGADVTWTNVLGGRWLDATNWSSGKVPAAGDAVFVSVGGDYTIEVTSAVSIGKLVADATTGRQVIAVKGSSMSLAGASRIGPRAVMEMGATSVLGAGALEVEGELRMRGGSLAKELIVATNGLVTLEESVAKSLSAGIKNHGQIRWTGGDVTSGTISNYAGAVMEIRAAATLRGANGNAVLVNEGLLRCAVSGGTVVAQIRLVQSNRLEVVSGAVVVSGISSWSGETEVQNGAVLGVTTTQGVASGTRYLGAGVVEWRGGVATLDGEIRGENVRLAGGSVAGTNVLQGIWKWMTGNWDARTTLSDGALLALEGSAARMLRGTVTNYGIIRWPEGGTLSVGRVYNEPGGVWEILGHGIVQGTGSGFGIHNRGEVRLTGGQGTNSVRVPFNSTGTVDVLTGTLEFAAGGTGGGVFQIGEEATLLYSSAYTHGAGTSFRGNGAVRLTRGAHVLTGVELPSNLWVEGAAVTGVAEVSGILEWRSGTIAAPALLIRPSAELRVSGAAKTLTGTMQNDGLLRQQADALTVTQGATNVARSSGTWLVERGTLTWSGGRLQYVGGEWKGDGVVQLQNLGLELSSPLTNQLAGLRLVNVTAQGVFALVNPKDHELLIRGTRCEVPLWNHGLMSVGGTSRLAFALDIPEDAVMRLVGESVSSHAALTVWGGVTNRGQISLEGSAGLSATLTVTNGLLLNATNGVMATSAATPGSVCTFAGWLLNQGRFEAAATTVIRHPEATHANGGLMVVRTNGTLSIVQTGTAPTFSNVGEICAEGGGFTLSQPAGAVFNSTGIMEASAGRMITVGGGVFNYLGGTLQGAGTILLSNVTATFARPHLPTEGTLHLSGTVLNGTEGVMLGQAASLLMDSSRFMPSLGNDGYIRVRGRSIMSGSLNNRATGVLRVVGESALRQGALNVAEGFGNYGTIELLSQSGKYPGTLAVERGALVNTVSGLIHSLPGSGGTNALETAVINEGTIRVEAPLHWARAGAIHSNAGLIRLEMGILQVTESLTLNEASRLEVVLGGATAEVMQGQLRVKGILRLAGALELSVAPNYVPRPGERFVVGKFGRRESGFGRIGGLDIGGFMVLQAFAQPDALTVFVKSLPGYEAPVPTNLVTQHVLIGGTSKFTLAPKGLPPFQYQWLFNGSYLTGATNGTLVIANAQRVQDGVYGLIVTDANQVITVYEGRLRVLGIPEIAQQPASVTNSANTTVTLRAGAGGTDSPFGYQWRLNGVNIPGATNSTLVITNVQPSDGGFYGVLMSNPVAVTNSSLAQVVVRTGVLPLADKFGSGAVSNTLVGVGASDTTAATREAGEPQHAGRPGGRSLWLRWQAPTNGLAVFSTRGSDFDTLLAAYTGDRVESLSEVDADDDRGGYGTSQIVFNAVAGTLYHVAVDGLEGAAGRVVLSWRLDTVAPLVPRIVSQPISVTVPEGGRARFSVFAFSQLPLRYQWLQNQCLRMEGGDEAALELNQVGFVDVGNYSVEVGDDNGALVSSLPAALELGVDPKSLSYDKIEDALRDAGFAGPSLQRLRGWPRRQFTSVSAGVPGHQLLSNFGATTQLGEPNHGGVAGGASRWFRLACEEDGWLVLDTLGSDMDTVMAVYTGASLATLKMVASDNDGAPDGLRSYVRFAAKQGESYLVAVDGVQGAEGNIQLNWNLETQAQGIRFTDWSVVAGGRWRLRAVVSGDGAHVLQATRDLRDWRPVQTNESAGGVVEFEQLLRADVGGQYFRVQAER